MDKDTTSDIAPPAARQAGGLGQYALAALALLLVLSASLALRLYPTLTSPSLKKMLSLPVLSEYDGYYYLRYAKEYCAGTYEAGETDALRGTHNERERVRLPLLSAAACYAHKATGVSMEHVALFLPLVFSAFVSIPIWLYRKQIGGELVAAVAIAFTLTSPAYVLRTRAGFFDTDCLIPFFMLMVLWFLQRAAETRRWRGVAYAAFGGLLFRLFMLWYDKGVLFYVFGVVLAGLIVLYWSKSGPGFGVLKLLAFGLAGYQYKFKMVAPVLWTQQYVSTNVVQGEYYAGLPNVAISVSELARQPFWTRVIQVHLAPFAIAGAVGLLWLAASRRRDVASLLPALALGMIGMWSGMRYLIYMVPVFGIGLGFLVVKGSEALSGRFFALRTRPFALFAAVSVALAVVVLAPRKPHEYDSIFNRTTVQAFAFLRGQEPGMVWNWWDQGYAIQYISGQPTYVDGGVNNNAYYVSLSLAQPNQRYMFNIIKNVLNAQTKTNPCWQVTDIEKLRAEPQGSPDMPVYILLTNDMLDKHIWINYYGKWDFKEGKGDREQKLWYLGTAANSQAQGIFTIQRAKVDLMNGTVFFQGQLVLIRGVHRVSDDNPRLQTYTEFPFGGNSSFVLELVRHSTHTDAFLVDKDFYETQFNRMLILGDIDPSLFDLVYSNPMMMTKVLRLK